MGASTTTMKWWHTWWRWWRDERGAIGAADPAGITALTVLIGWFQLLLHDPASAVALALAALPALAPIFLPLAAGMAAARGWREVTRGNPCPVCGKPDWCSVSTDGAWAVCRRVDDGRGEHRVDRAGMDYWLYRLRPGPAPKTADLPACEAEAERADPDTLDRVYRRLLNELTLSPEHRENLRKRGLPDSEIDRRGYRSLLAQAQDRADLARRVLDAFDFGTLARTPGFYLQEQGGERRRWSLAGPTGLAVPCRDTEGRIVALKVRADEPGNHGKYLYLSSKAHGGPGPGAPVHVPVFDGTVGDTVRITEGELKSDIATVLSGTLTISVPGVSCWRAAIPVLKALGAKRARLAFDADWRRNRHVARALRNALKALNKEGFIVQMEAW